MSELVVVRADTLPGLLGAGAVCCEWAIGDKPGPLCVVFARVGERWRYVVPYMSTRDNEGRCYEVPASDLFLILHDPDDPDVSAAGIARAERALRMQDPGALSDGWFAWCEGGSRGPDGAFDGPPHPAEIADVLRTAILAAAEPRHD